MSDRQNDYISMCEYIKANVKCLDIARNANKTVRCVSKSRGEYTLTENDSIRINDEKNLWYRHSQSIGGSCIDLYMWLYDCDFNTAVSDIRKTYLAGKNASVLRTAPKREQRTDTKTTLKLPPKAPGKCRRVFAYLHKTRKIQKSVVSWFVNHRRVYEDAEYHSCVFVSYYDEQRKYPAFAFKRGSATTSKFKGIVPGSDYNVGFTIDNNSDTLFVCEGIIDVMSIMSFMDLKGVSFLTSDYIALCGISTVSLFAYLSQSAGRIHKIYLCLDNDETGQKRTQNILSELGDKYEIEVIKPMHKDFNEDLQKTNLQLQNT